MTPSQKEIDQLLLQLKDPEPHIREQATEILWKNWFWQKGVTGMEQLKRSQVLIDEGKIEDAEETLTQLIQAHPDFAEAWNRRAVLYYLQQDFQKSIDDCQETLKIFPFHFGALHGLGLCYAAQGEIKQAIATFTCTKAEEEKIAQSFFAQQEVTSKAEFQTWLQHRGLTLLI